MEELQSTKDEYSLVYQFWHLLKQNLLSYVDFFLASILQFSDLEKDWEHLKPQICMDNK